MRGGVLPLSIRFCPLYRPSLSRFGPLSQCSIAANRRLVYQKVLRVEKLVISIAKVSGGAADLVERHRAVAGSDGNFPRRGAQLRHILCRPKRRHNQFRSFRDLRIGCGAADSMIAQCGPFVCSEAAACIPRPRLKPVENCRFSAVQPISRSYCAGAKLLLLTISVISIPYGSSPYEAT